MLTILADVLMSLTGQHKTRHDRYPDSHADNPWADRFVPRHRRSPRDDAYRFDVQRDFW